MDVVGAVASIGSIIDIITRSLLKLYDLRKKIKDSPIALTAFVGELTATKAALRELKAGLTEENLTADTVSPFG